MCPATNSSRWCPTPEQLMILEEMYRVGIRTPNASQIQQITAHLSFYGRIEGKNVFYWFQNHKARDRQKLRRKLFKQIQQQQFYHHQQYLINRHNFTLLYYLDQPHCHQWLCNSSGFRIHRGYSGEDATTEELMNTRWKVEIADNQGAEKEKSLMMRMYGRDWMMMMADVGRQDVTSPKNRPMETLELFPIRETNLKEDSATFKDLSCSSSINSGNS